MIRAALLVALALALTSCASSDDQKPSEGFIGYAPTTWQDVAFMGCVAVLVVGVAFAIAWTARRR